MENEEAVRGSLEQSDKQVICLGAQEGEGGRELHPALSPE